MTLRLSPFIVTLFTLLAIFINLASSSIILINEPRSNFVELTFDEYLIKFNKNYQTQDEITFRRQVFQINLVELRELAKTCKSCGITKFTDWTKEQRKSLRGKLPQTSSLEIQQTSMKGNSITIQLPRTFDWRNFKAITPVKNQECGNCWAYTITAFFESQFIRRGQADSNIDLAEQFFMQCDTQSSGCQGGLLEPALDLGLKAGVPYEKDYPIKIETQYSDICQPKRIMALTKSRRITRKNIPDNEIIRMLVQRPLAIGVDSRNWENYAPTIQNRLLECQNNASRSTELDHAALLVGYTEKEWILKNSWGQDSGVDGYFYVSRNSSHNCGIGMEILSLDFNLPSVDGGVVFPNLKELSCEVPNCIQCNNAGKICIECQGRFELNEQGKCDEVQNNTQLMSLIDYTIPEQTLRTNCSDANCESCGDQNGKEFCAECKKGFAFNEKTGNCEKSPIENCDYFEVKKGRTICYECYKNYYLENNKCVVDDQQTENQVNTTPLIQIEQFSISDSTPNNLSPEAQNSSVNPGDLSKEQNLKQDKQGNNYIDHQQTENEVKDRPLIRYEQNRPAVDFEQNSNPSPKENILPGEAQNSNAIPSNSSKQQNLKQDDQGNTRTQEKQ